MPIRTTRGGGRPRGKRSKRPWSRSDRRCVDAWNGGFLRSSSVHRLRSSELARPLGTLTPRGADIRQFRRQAQRRAARLHGLSERLLRRSSLPFPIKVCATFILRAGPRQRPEPIQDFGGCPVGTQAWRLKRQLSLPVSMISEWLWRRASRSVVIFGSPTPGAIRQCLWPSPRFQVAPSIAVQLIGRQKGDMSSALRFAQSSSGIRSSARFWPSCRRSNASS